LPLTPLPLPLPPPLPKLGACLGRKGEEGEETKAYEQASREETKATKCKGQQEEEDLN
jgi:hypothetical protein